MSIETQPVQHFSKYGLSYGNFNRSSESIVKATSEEVSQHRALVGLKVYQQKSNDWDSKRLNDWASTFAHNLRGMQVREYEWGQLLGSKRLSQEHLDLVKSYYQQESLAYRVKNQVKDQIITVTEKASGLFSRLKTSVEAWLKGQDQGEKTNKSYKPDFSRDARRTSSLGYSESVMAAGAAFLLTSGVISQAVPSAFELAQKAFRTYIGGETVVLTEANKKPVSKDPYFTDKLPQVEVLVPVKKAGFIYIKKASPEISSIVGSYCHSLIGRELTPFEAHLAAGAFMLDFGIENDRKVQPGQYSITSESRLAKFCKTLPNQVNFPLV